jgi:hypothetical protein
MDEPDESYKPRWDEQTLLSSPRRASHIHPDVAWLERDWSPRCRRYSRSRIRHPVLQG